MEELGLVVNFDYEFALFDPSYGFDSPKYKKMRSRFEYLYLLCGGESPLFNECTYSDEYLKHLKDNNFITPKLSNKKGTNWVGKLEHLELERKFNSKHFSTQLRKDLFKLDDAWIVESKDDLRDVRSFEKYIVKDPYTFAGIGQKIVDKLEFTKPCIIERFYQRILDFSVHRDGDIFINLNNRQGSFRGLAFKQDNQFEILNGFDNEIKKALELVFNVMPTDYDFSIDMFLYNENGEVELHPLVEINMRKTMNIIGRRLKHLAKDKIGVWSLKEQVSDNAIQLAPDFCEKSYLQLISEDELIKYIKNY